MAALLKVMSVPEYLRSESSMEFLHNLHKLRRNINDLLGRDFGLKPRTYDIDLLKKIYEPTDEDAALLVRISAKYGMNSYEIDRFPRWLVDSIRQEVRWELKHLCVEVELANSIWLSDERTHNARRTHWDLAIGYCNALKDSLHEVVDCFKVKPSFIEETITMIDREIKLLKGMRKSDNKRLNNKQGLC